MPYCKLTTLGDWPTGTVLKDSLVLDEEKVEELDGHAGANACDEVGQSQEKWHVLASEAFVQMPTLKIIGFRVGGVPTYFGCWQVISTEPEQFSKTRSGCHRFKLRFMVIGNKDPPNRADTNNPNSHSTYL